MGKMAKYVGTGSAVLIVVTLALFVVSLFVKGFTKDMLIEGAVFLVSAKLIVSSYRSSGDARAILERIDRIQKTLDERATPPRP